MTNDAPVGHGGRAAGGGAGTGGAAGPAVGGETLSLNEERGRKKGEPAARPQLFLVLELDRPIASSGRYSLADIDEVHIGRGAKRAAERLVESGSRRLKVRVPDRWMSSAHIRLGKVFGRWIIDDAGSKNGTFVNGNRVQNVTLADGDLIELGHTFFLYRDTLALAADDPIDLEGAQLHAVSTPGLTTLVAPLARQLVTMAQLAQSPVSVILRGESGTGKEVIARAVHELSDRPGAFVAVNCGALPDTLVETELFGYRKGAFSGAVEDRPGLVRAADRGTLFLDEIGDLPPASQAAFLRVLQEREVMPVGGTRPVPVDVRLVAATHRDLKKLVDEDKFRGDLHARIAGFTLHLPPLRERREDLGLLIGVLLRRADAKLAETATFSIDAGRALFRHRWPANIRELEKTLGAALVLSRGGVIELEHLPEEVRAALLAPAAGSPAAGGRSGGGGAAADDDGAADDAEDAAPGPLSAEDQRRRVELEQLLTEHGGNISAVARVMGKARMQIQRWCKRYRLDPGSFRK